MQTPPSALASRRNLEIKARCSDLVAARRAALALGASVLAVENQTDTFFHVARGRLKLREIEGQASVLIPYRRDDSPAVRRSEYRIVPVAEPELLKAALDETIGIRAIVRKRREILLWHEVRIHLDHVVHLGHFVELEAVLDADPSDEAPSRQRLDHLMHALGIESGHAIATAYVDLVLEAIADER